MKKPMEKNIINSQRCRWIWLRFITKWVEAKLKKALSLERRPLKYRQGSWVKIIFSWLSHILILLLCICKVEITRMPWSILRRPRILWEINIRKKTPLWSLLIRIWLLLIRRQTITLKLYFTCRELLISRLLLMERKMRELRSLEICLED